MKFSVQCTEITAIEPRFHCVLVVFEFVVTPSLFAVSGISRELTTHRAFWSME